MDSKEGNMKNKNTIHPHHDQYVANKKRGPLNMIKIAMFMLRHKSMAKKSNSLNVDVIGSKGLWKRIVGAMRPLHHHHQLEHHHRLQLPPPTTTTMQPNIPSLVLDSSLDAPPLPPLSPMGSESSSSSFSNGTVSQYASAQNLQELDNGNDDDNNDDDDDGDEMIDARAEEFIANFYEQIRLQRLDSFN